MSDPVDRQLKFAGLCGRRFVINAIFMKKKAIVLALHNIAIRHSRVARSCFEHSGNFLPDGREIECAEISSRVSVIKINFRFR